MNVEAYRAELDANDQRLPKVVTRTVYRNGRSLGQVTYREHECCWPFTGGTFDRPLYFQ